MGRMGRSTNRATSTSSSRGRSRFRKEPLQHKKHDRYAGKEFLGARASYMTVFLKMVFEPDAKKGYNLPARRPIASDQPE